MQNLFNGLPVFNALIDDEEAGVYCVSLVTNPATEVNFVYFDKDKPIQKFAVADKTQHIVAGVIMVANTPIYRVAESGFEYYINYQPETLKVMAEKMIFDNVGSQINIEHQDGTNVEGVNLQQLFIIDRENGINPKFFENVPDGSLIGYYKVHNPEVWSKIENGDVLSFSLEGYFSLEEQVNQFKGQAEDEEEQEVLALIEKIKSKINK